MTTIIEEGEFSGDAEIGESASGVKLYYAFDDAGDEVAAHAAVVAASPIVYRGMPRRGSSIKRLTRFAGNVVYEVPVRYAFELNQVTPSDPTGQTSGLAQFDSTLTFNLVGGTTHITQALETTSHVPSGETVVDIKRTIGLDLKTGQVRGLDVFAPVLDFTRTAQFPNHVVTDAYIDDLYTLTGRTNNASFKGRAAGEILFKGARGSKRGQEMWEIAFEFAYSPNEIAISIGNGITVAEKKGWEYLDILYKDGTDSIGGKLIQIPAQANIHKVFKDGDFSKLKIGVS